MLPPCVRSLVARGKGYPFSSHPPPRRLPGEMPTLGQGDRSNDHPQRGGQDEDIGQEGYSCRYRCEDEDRAGCKARVHERRHEQTPTSTVVDPHHKHPIGRQLRYSTEEVQGQEEGQGKFCGVRAAYPRDLKQVPHSPQEANDESRAKDTVTQPQ